jgi:hypothetical protein
MVQIFAANSLSLQRSLQWYRAFEPASAKDVRGMGCERHFFIFSFSKLARKSWRSIRARRIWATIGDCVLKPLLCSKNPCRFWLKAVKACNRIVKKKKSHFVSGATARRGAWLVGSIVSYITRLLSDALRVTLSRVWSTRNKNSESPLHSHSYVPWLTGGRAFWSWSLPWP